MTQNIIVSKKEMELINDLLGLTTEEIYQKYGYMGNNAISHSTTFPNGIEARINLSVINEKDWSPITDITLFKEDKELTHNTSEDSHYEGTWWIEYEGIEYVVNVIVEDWFDVNAEWIKTDDFQWRKLINATTFHLVEVREQPDGYVYVSGIIDINDYDDEEKESIITAYYSSVEEFKTSYSEEEINGILAECIFEQIHEIELTCFGLFNAKAEAEEKALDYISKQK